MSFAFSLDFLKPTSDFQMPITFLLVDKNTKYGFRFLNLNLITRKILVIKLSGFAEIFTFSTPAPVVLVLADMAHSAMSSLIGRNVRKCMKSYSTKKSVTIKII